MTKSKVIRKAVFPVAGMGTRFLPATKAMPKELLPIVDKPIIQFAVEEAIEAGITDMVFVTGRTKRAIEDHFDGNAELEATLESRGKDDLVEMVRNIIPPGVSCVFVRQAEALGLGHAVLCAEPAVGGGPFAVLLPDDLMAGAPSPTKALVDHFAQTGKPAISVMPVAQDQIDKYGGVVNPPVTDAALGTVGMAGIVEKPASDKAPPSNLAAVGRYVFDNDIFDHLRNLPPGVGGGEIQLTDAINIMASQRAVDAVPITGKRYDCGSKFGYLEAIVDHALAHPDFASDFADVIVLKAERLAQPKTGTHS